MKRKGCGALLVVMLLGSWIAPYLAVAKNADLVDEANQSIMVAEKAVVEARAAIENGKMLIARIPDDSSFAVDVKQMLVAASDNWTVAVGALESAKKSAAKIATTSAREAVAEDFALLAKGNASVALSGAMVVQISLHYVEAVADNKTESLGIIQAAMQDALASASQVQASYEQLKALIAKKYSK